MNTGNIALRGNIFTGLGRTSNSYRRLPGGITKLRSKGEGRVDNIIIKVPQHPGLNIKGKTIIPMFPNVCPHESF